MCGIVGCLKLNDGLDWVSEQIQKIDYRGPDSQISRNVTSELVMGVARLAMTDPHPRSNQPMIDRDSGNAISFNGEIYNYLEIRKMLISQGVKFETESDTEVLLKYLGKVGFSRLSDLNGMYAFAFYSKSENQLYLSRDGLGKKPIYILKEGMTLKWSSSIASLQTPNSVRVISNDALIQYLSLGYLLDQTTTDSNIFALVPGEILTVDLASSNINSSISSNIEFDKKSSSDKSRIPLREVIGQSVKDRISGHVSVAISLSGGVDSSVLAIELANRNISSFAFTACWADSDKERYNLDAKVAKSVCSKIGINLEQVEMTQARDLPTELSRFLVAMQEPNNNPTGVSMLRLYERIASAGHRLVITGDGSDEIFGGYQRYASVNIVKSILNLQNERLVRKTFADVRNRRSFFRRVLETQLAPNSPFSWLRWHWIFTPRELTQISSESFSKSWSPQVLAKSVQAIDPNNYSSNPESLMKRDHAIWLAMESNRKLDRISMHYSIEARSPFQDERVIDWANSYMRRTRHKNLSKAVLWQEYPELGDLGVRRDKAGFTSPVGHWLRANPKLVINSLDILARDSRFSKTGLSFYQDAPERGRYRELMQLWTLVVLATWLQMDE